MEPGEPVPALVLVSGFGAFERVDANPSGFVARALEAAPPVGARVRAIELPVSFARAPAALEAFVGGLPAPPDLLVGLGVQKQAGFRVELAARGVLERATRPDVDGVVAADATRACVAPVLRTRLEARLAQLCADRAGWGLSEDAGGYVCERVYHGLLALGIRLGRPAVFVHVPPERFVPKEEQAREVGEFVAALVASASS